MSTRLFEGIVTKWDADSLDATFPGGIWYRRADGNVAWPYVVFTPVANTTRSWSSEHEYRDQVVQFTIFYQEDGTNDPISALGTLLRTLLASMDGVTLASGGAVMSARRARDDIIEDPSEDGIWQGQLDIRYMRSDPL